MLGSVYYLRFINHHYETIREESVRLMVAEDLKVIVKMLDHLVTRMGHPVWETLLQEALQELLSLLRTHYSLFRDISDTLNNMMW